MQLRKSDVLNGALALLDEDGLDGLTMRKLATQLDVQAGALYWHFENKQSLLDALAEKLVEGVGAPVPPGTWDERLAILAGRLRDNLLAHRDGARVVAGTYVAEPNTLLAGKASVDILYEAGIPLDQAGWITFAIFYYVLGHTIEEQSQRQLLRHDDWDSRLAAVAEQQDPMFAHALESVVSTDPAERFVYGLQLFLDGVRCRLSQPEQERLHELR
jgi:TetR/AcrR family transcriptional regulator, tetracycline repressor protein